MVDRLTKEQRRQCMSRVRGKNTKPELIVRKALWSNGVRYRVQNKLPGKPDIVFPKSRLAIFIDGCFWHCCPEHGTLPKSNADFWKNKLTRNVERDREVTELLEASGWRVFRIWEHEVKADPDQVVKKIAGALGQLKRGLAGYKSGR